MKHLRFVAALAFGSALAASCGGDNGEGGATNEGEGGEALACDAEPVIRETSAGVKFVRTPDTCFAALPNWPYAPNYVELDGLRQAYIDEGPSSGPVVLLLHGQPSWSYLYRKMIPTLVQAGFRVIAMDHLGMGRSDKPIDLASYSYLGHTERLQRFVETLDLRDINLFVQDWGSLIGLRVVGLHPERFARVAVGDGTLAVVPAGVQPYPPVEDPDTVVDLRSPFADFPPQQPAFYDGCTPLTPPNERERFGEWITYAMKARDFRPSEVVEALTWFDLPDAEQAAYDAPFPSRVYLTGARVFPSLINELPGINQEAWAGLTSFEKPFFTVWASNDPGTLGQCATQDNLSNNIPGAKGVSHARLPQASHFLQDDQGEAIAQRLVGFYSSSPLRRGDRYCEVLLVQVAETATLQAEVWGTQGLNDCPAAAWDALDSATLATDTGALAVQKNGPRLWLPSYVTSSLASTERRKFGELEMRLLAKVDVDAGSQSSKPYEGRAVRRTTTYTFASGQEVYELTSPEGVVYVMQSMSLMVDPSLTLAQLATIGTRLRLPPGWAYRARTLDADLVMVVDGVATVLQDDLLNTYQKM